MNYLEEAKIKYEALKNKAVVNILAIEIGRAHV